jgi:hypothetical protein
MIAIAVAAVLMGFLRLPIQVRRGVELILFFAVIVGGFAELVTFSAYFWPGARPRDQYLRRIKYRPEIRQADPKRGGGERVG